MVKAVITGDIINSRNLSPKSKQLLYQKLEQFIGALSKGSKFKGETNHGDWFQCLIDDPALSLRYSLVIKCYLKSFTHFEKINTTNDAKGKIADKATPNVATDARIAIGIGNVEFISKRLGASDGQAFQLSGRLLTKMKQHGQGLSADVADTPLREELQTLLLLLDTIIQKCTPLQCQVIYHKLFEQTETEIARKLRIMQSAVNQRSTAAGWRAIESAIIHFEKTIKDYYA